MLDAEGGYFERTIRMSNHVGLWIDTKEARIFSLNQEAPSATVVTPPRHHIHHRHMPLSEGIEGHRKDAKAFFKDVAEALQTAEDILVVGPSTTKLEFLRYVHKHDKKVEARIVGIETVERPTDLQFVAFAKSYFKRAGDPD